MNQSENREVYLVKAVGIMTDHFIAKGYKVPNLRVSCGWPNSGGTRAKKRVLGQAWSSDAAADGVIQIFVSPYLADKAGHVRGLLCALCNIGLGSFRDSPEALRNAALYIEGKL